MCSDLNWHNIEKRKLKARNREIDCINNAEFRYRNQVKRSPILRGFVNIFFFLYEWTSLSIIIRFWSPRWRNNLLVVDWHRLSWLMVTFFSFLGLILFPSLRSNRFFFIPILVITIWSWKDMVTVWVTNHMLRRNSANNIRVLVLSGINVVELIFIFSIWYSFTSKYFTAKNQVPAFKNGYDTLRFSVDNLFESCGRINIQGWGLVPYYVERFTGVLLVVIIIALVMSYFGNDKKT